MEDNDCEARIDELERRVDELESAGPEIESSHDDTRIDELERRVDELESAGREIESSDDATGLYLGYVVGMSLAVVLSWSRNVSIVWCIVHGLCSWAYVIYFAVTR